MVQDSKYHTLNRLKKEERLFKIFNLVNFLLIIIYSFILLETNLYFILLFFGILQIIFLIGYFDNKKGQRDYQAYILRYEEKWGEKRGVI